jgi:hypothetical protein
MRLVQELVDRTECRGAGFERPTTSNGLCLECATMRKLTEAQREMVLAYKGHVSGKGSPRRIKYLLDLCPSEHDRGCTLAGFRRVIENLERKGLMCLTPEMGTIQGASLTELGRRVAKRING